MHSEMSKWNYTISLQLVGLIVQWNVLMVRVIVQWSEIFNVWWNTLGCVHKVWQEARSQLQENQKELRALVMQRWHGHGHGPIVWPPHLAQEIPTFARWLLDHFKTQMVNGVVVDPDVVVYSSPPSTSAYTYNNMWAYGNHYKVDVETRPTHAMYGMVLHAYSGKVVTVLYEIRTF